MNTFKKAALLTLVFTNCAFYASEKNEQNSPTLRERITNFAYSAPRSAGSAVWNNKGKIVGAGILSFLSVTYGQAQVMADENKRGVLLGATKNNFVRAKLLTSCLVWLGLWKE